MNKICIACGMPMESLDDFALKDSSKDYCCYCARTNGEMQSYEERLENYSGWLMKTQGLTKAAAISQSKTIMSQLPAWKHIPVKE
jgi:hypothetical protein